MIILRRVIYFFLIVEVPNTQCSIFERCWPTETCHQPLEIETRQESVEAYNPLYLIGRKGSYELAFPHAPEKSENQVKNTNVKVFLSGKQKLIYACPKTSKSNPKEKVSSALLQQKDIKLTSNHNAVNEYCTQKVEPMMRNLNEPCGGSELSEFYLYEVGFKVFIKHRSMKEILTRFFTRVDIEKPTWHTLYVICHNTKTKTTVFATHTLYGESIRLNTPKFSGTFREVNEIESINEATDKEIVDRSSVSVSMNKIFKKESVRSLFEKLFRKSSDRYFQGEQDYLARGHLVPDADMIFIPWKNATYLYSNVAPMWQILNNGVWKIIENQIRKFAERTEQKLIIYTGVYQTLSYDDQSISRW